MALNRVWKSTLPMAIAIGAIDQLSKYLLLEWVDIDTRMRIILTPFFQLVMVWNTGISFGMLSHPGTYVPWFLIAVAVGISGVVWQLARRSQSRVERLAYGAIIGGAMGNVVDRVCFGAVADFFSFHLGDWYYPAFNVADAAIFLGVATLVWLSIRK